MGNPILSDDAIGILLASALKPLLEDIPGVVCCGIFARRAADVLLVGRADGSVETRRAF